jgi:hypothetical protein
MSVGANLISTLSYTIWSLLTLFLSSNSHHSRHQYHAGRDEFVVGWATHDGL